MCISSVAVVVHMFVFIVVTCTAGHGKECVMDMVMVESADSPLSAMAVLPKVQVYVRSRSSMSSHVLFLLHSCSQLNTHGSK